MTVNTKKILSEIDVQNAYTYMGKIEVEILCIKLVKQLKDCIDRIEETETVLSEYANDDFWLKKLEINGGELATKAELIGPMLARNILKGEQSEKSSIEKVG